MSGRTAMQEYIDRQAPLTWHWIVTWGYTYDFVNGPGRALMDWDERIAALQDENNQ